VKKRSTINTNLASEQGLVEDLVGTAAATAARPLREELHFLLV
jgi:hypothetical protein